MRRAGIAVAVVTLAGCAGELVVVEPTPAPSVAEAADVAGFYGALADDGSWIDTDAFGDVWCPSVGDGFTPYSRGHFVFGEDGWTWAGDLPFSWAVEHYGRWAALDLPGCAWGWVPDGEWGPAWVDFESGDGFVGWSPRPPAAGRRVRVAAPPTVRVAMAHVSVAHVAAPAPAQAAPATVTMAKLPGARGAAAAASSSAKSSSASQAKVVVVVREADFLAPDVLAVMLRGDARASIGDLRPVAAPGVPVARAEASGGGFGGGRGFTPAVGPAASFGGFAHAGHAPLAHAAFARTSSPARFGGGGSGGFSRAFFGGGGGRSSSGHSGGGRSSSSHGGGHAGHR